MAANGSHISWVTEALDLFDAQRWKCCHETCSMWASISLLLLQISALVTRNMLLLLEGEFVTVFVNFAQLFFAHKIVRMIHKKKTVGLV